MVADEWHKSAAFQHLGGESITASYDEPQFLMLSVSHRENQPPPFGKLRKEGLRRRRSSSGDKDGGERCEFRQSKCPVAAMHMRRGVGTMTLLGSSALRQLRAQH